MILLLDSLQQTHEDEHLRYSFNFQDGRLTHCYVQSQEGYSQFTPKTYLPDPSQTLQAKSYFAHESVDPRRVRRQIRPIEPG